MKKVVLVAFVLSMSSFAMAASSADEKQGSSEGEWVGLEQRFCEGCLASENFDEVSEFLEELLAASTPNPVLIKQAVARLASLAKNPADARKGFRIQQKCRQCLEGSAVKSVEPAIVCAEPFAAKDVDAGGGICVVTTSINMETGSFQQVAVGARGGAKLGSIGSKGVMADKPLPCPTVPQPPKVGGQIVDEVAAFFAQLTGEKTPAEREEMVKGLVLKLQRDGLLPTPEESQGPVVAGDDASAAR